MVTELGRYLKEVRQEQKLTLEEIQEVTKIRRRYLEAIEKGEYNALPGAFYTRAFVKSYAEALGLEPDQVLEKYADDLPQMPQAPVESMPPRARRRSRRRKQTRPNRGKWVSNLIFYGFLFLIGLVIYISIVSMVNPEAEAPIAEPPGVDSEGELPTDVPEEENSTSDEEGHQTDNQGDAQQETESVQPALTRGETEGNRTYFTYETEGDEVIVRLEAVEGNVWFSLNDELTGREIEQMELPIGSSKEWDVAQYELIRLHLGNTNGAQLYINNQPIDLSDLSQVHHIVIQL